MNNSPKRQFILIMTDTQRIDMCGCYGHPEMRTPNLDRLAAEGLRFGRAYTCQPVCAPARSAIFTGTFPHSNGCWGNSMALGDNVKTLGQRLSDNGVHSAYVGKWHLDGGDYFGLGRCPDGWDSEYWYDMRVYLDELTPEERLASRKTSSMNDAGLAEEFTYGHRVATHAGRFIEAHRDHDFFLTVSFDEPHGPFLSPEPYASMYENYRFPLGRNARDTLENKPEHQQVWAKNRNSDPPKSLELTAFLGCNSFVDYEIGRVLETIDAYCPNAVVLYTSDHGDALRAHGLNGKGPTVYDEITRIPLIVRWPEVIAPNASTEVPASHIDVVPTVLEYFGLPRPKVLEGKSMIDGLKSPRDVGKRDVFIEFGRYEIDHDGFGGFQPLRCIFDGRYKLAINLLSSDELYDLDEDPDELKNLIDAPDHHAVRNALHDRLLEWMNRTRDPFRGYYWERRPWREDARPASWGYTGMTRQRENEEYEPRQLDYDTGLPIREAVRKKL